LLAEVSDEDFVPYEIPGRIRCDELDEFLRRQKIDIWNPQSKAALRTFIQHVVPDAQRFVEELANFVHVEARLPAMDKNFVPGVPAQISTDQSREQIIDHLRQLRASNPTADLAFYAYRDMGTCDWTPFIKAAVERNPVSVEMTGNMSVEQAYGWLNGLINESIYPDDRLAQPDEVVNYGRGDGVEKALALANIIRQRSPEQDIEIKVEGNNVALKGPKEYGFLSGKGFEKHITISQSGDINAG
jgi:hypothetical protein